MDALLKNSRKLALVLVRFDYAVGGIVNANHGIR
jgi:hypothetical protein